MPAANGGTNCTGDGTETEGFVMLAGGTLAGGADSLEPIFFSINPSVPLPASLSGTKNPIDGNDRRWRPAMIETPGKKILKSGSECSPSLREHVVYSVIPCMRFETKSSCDSDVASTSQLCPSLNIAEIKAG